MEKSKIVSKLKHPTQYNFANKKLLREDFSNVSSSTTQKPSGNSSSTLPPMAARRVRRSKSFCALSKIASKLKLPTQYNFAYKMPLREVSSNASSSTTQKPPGSSSSTLPSLAARRARRSKSFCSSTLQSTIRPHVANSIFLNKNVTINRPGINRAPISGLISAASSSTTMPQTKAAVKPHAETAKPSAPKLSKFDYKGRFAMLEEKHKLLVNAHKEVKNTVVMLEEEKVSLKKVIEDQSKSLKELEPYKVRTEALHKTLRQTQTKLHWSLQKAQDTSEKLDKTVQLAFHVLNDTQLRTENSVLELLEEHLAPEEEPCYSP